MKILNFTLARIHTIVILGAVISLPLICNFKDYDCDFKKAKTEHL